MTSTIGLYELIGAECSKLAAQLTGLIAVMTAAGHDPDRIEIEPCGILTEVSLCEIRRALSDIARWQLS